MCGWCSKGGDGEDTKNALKWACFLCPDGMGEAPNTENRPNWACFRCVGKGNMTSTKDTPVWACLSCSDGGEVGGGGKLVILY